MMGNNCVSIKVLCGVDFVFLLLVLDIAAAMTEDVLFCIPLVMVDMKEDSDDEEEVDAVGSLVIVALSAVVIVGGKVGGDGVGTEDDMM